MENEMIYDAEVMDGGELTPYNGAIQTKTAYTTAMQVIRPRNLALVEQKVLQEAAIAGDEFYYSWSQKDNKTQRTTIIEGLTVGAAMAIARNMGNCAIPVTVEENKEAYTFTATFIDLETGFNLQRNFRQRKSQNVGAKMKQDGRADDIIFQIGQSKAIRNVITSATPKWLQSKVLAKAKANVRGQIEQMGKEKAASHILSKANRLSISQEVIEASFGKMAGWDTEKLVLISGALRAVEDGLANIDEAFPSIKDDKLKDEIGKGVKAETKKVAETDDGIEA